jgi:NAD(P)-dependent dehydrogenase (short-subunit alcohol dehydrogenase family)
MENRVAWIIGGGSGIGAAVALELAARGWTVAISGRRRERLEDVAAGHAGIHAYPLDVTYGTAVIATVDRIISDLGHIDLMLFGAVAAVSAAPGHYPADKFEAALAINVLGLARLLDPLVAHMAGRGGGQIAVLASLAGYFGLPRSAMYSASKAALISLCQTLRTELGPKKIDVRVIAPGYVKSELTARNDFPMPFLMETDDAARRIVDGLTRSRRFEIAFPWQMVWAMKLLRVLPYPLVFALMARLMPKRR